MKISEIVRSKGSRMTSVPPPPRKLSGPEPIPKNNVRKTLAQGHVKPLDPDPSSAAPAAEASPQSSEIYTKIIEQSRNFLSGFSAKPMRLPDLEEICHSIEQIILAIEKEPSGLLKFVCRSTPDDYLPGHISNVTILSLALSRQMQWPKENLMSLGVGAFLHDSGLAFHKAEISKKGALTPEERERLKTLPQEGLDRLKEFLKNLSGESNKIVENILLQCQERLSGQGYPKGLKGEQISLEAQVVGLSDTYESITHPRPHRAPKLPHDALRYLIELAGNSFESSLIKTFWETLTLFPPGSYIELNTGETAKIIRLNKKMPTRPVIQPVLSASGEWIKGFKLLDLSQLPGVVIEKAVDECALKCFDKRLLLELRAQKWWVR